MTDSFAKHIIAKILGDDNYVKKSERDLVYKK